MDRHNEEGTPCVVSNARRQTLGMETARRIAANGGAVILPCSDRRRKQYGTVERREDSARTSGEDVCDDCAMHVGEPKLPPLVLVRQPLVVDAHLMQNRRLQVVDMRRPLGDVFSLLRGVTLKFPNDDARDVADPVLKLLHPTHIPAIGGFGQPVGLVHDEESE